MKPVVAFWTANIQRQGSFKLGWFSEKTHWLSWVLSVNLIYQHYGRVCLVTDRLGWDILVDLLGLPFTDVSLDCEKLQTQWHIDPKHWVAGKLMSYYVQKEPFFSFDSDAFLWNKLPGYLENSGVFSQSPEIVTQGEENATWGYKPSVLSKYLKILPPYFGEKKVDISYCAGVWGGTNFDFFNSYSSIALNVLGCSENREGWEKLLADNNGGIGFVAPIVEQYFFGLECLNQSIKPVLWFDKDSGKGSVYDPICTERYGYTHLLSDSKANPEIAEALDVCVKAMYPEQYRKVQEFINNDTGKKLISKYAK